MLIAKRRIVSRRLSIPLPIPRGAAPLSQIAAPFPAAHELPWINIQLNPHLDENYLILSTVHSAKGQEWQNVFLLDVVDGTFPSEFACGEERLIEEERRLLYVAVTRAKSDLTLVQPMRFLVTHQPRHGGRHVYSAASRFMTPALVALCDEQCVAGPSADGVREAAVGGAAIDLPARMRELW